MSPSRPDDQEPDRGPADRAGGAGGVPERGDWDDIDLGRLDVPVDPEEIEAVRRQLAHLEGLDASPDDTLSIVRRQADALAARLPAALLQTPGDAEAPPAAAAAPPDADAPAAPPDEGGAPAAPSNLAGRLAEDADDDAEPAEADDAERAAPDAPEDEDEEVVPGAPTPGVGVAPARTAPDVGPAALAWAKRSRLSGRIDVSRLVEEATDRFDAETTTVIAKALVAPEEAELREQIARTWALLDRLERAEGMYTDPLEHRLAAAEALLDQGQVGAAEVLVEEICVLARAMDEAGKITPGPDPLEGKVAAIVAGAFQELIEGDLFAAKVNEKAARVVAQVLEDTISGPLFQAAVSRLVEKRLAAHLEEVAFERKVGALLERRLQAFLGEDAFRAAALDAVVSRPRPLLDRPEVLARIEAVARQLDRDLVESSALREKVDGAVRARAAALARALAAGQGGGGPSVEQALEDPRLAALVQARVDDALPRALDAPAARAALEAAVESKSQAWAAGLVASPQFQEGLDARVRRVVDEMVHGELFLTEVDMRTREVLKTAEFRLRLETLLRGSSALVEVLEERLDRSESLQRRLDARTDARLEEVLPRVLAERAHADRALVQELLDDGAFLAKIDEVTRKRTEALVEAAGFRAAVDARVRALTGELTDRLSREVDQRVQAASGDLAQAAADKALEAPALRARAEAVAARTVEPLLRDLSAKLDALERKVEVMVKAALAEGGAVEARLRQMAEQAAKGAVDEGWLRRVVQREIANREALATAKLSGGDGIEDPMTALLRSDAVRKIVAEHIAQLRRERKERQASRDDPPARGKERLARSELDTQHDPVPPRRPDKRGPPRPSGSGPIDERQRRAPPRG